MDLRETVQEWLVDAKFGLIEPAELTARADRAITEIDNPPDYLIALSLGEPLHFVDRLDLVKYRVTNKDLGGLAARMLEALEGNRVSIEEIAAVSARIGFPNHDSDMIDAWSQFCWITDELHLIEQGIKDSANFEEGVTAALREITQYAAAEKN